MPRRRGILAPQRRSRRQTEWGASADVTGFTALGATAAVLDQRFTQVILAGVTPATIVRTRGLIAVRTDQQIATEDPFGAIGFAVVRENAGAAGVGSLPTPITDEIDDVWFVHQFWTAGFLFTGASFADVTKVFEFDSKAMRKIVDGDSIVIMLENASATAGVSYLVKFRILFKLH